MKIPESSKIMSFNDANSHMWDEPLQNVAKGWREGTGKSGVAFTSRYIGSMVGDVHRTLMYGGVFGDPGDPEGHGDRSRGRAPARARHHGVEERDRGGHRGVRRGGEGGGKGGGEGTCGDQRCQLSSVEGIPGQAAKR